MALPELRRAGRLGWALEGSGKGIWSIKESGEREAKVILSAPRKTSERPYR